MTRSIKILNILIVFLWLGLTSCSKNSTNSDTENNERKAPGLLYFLTANPTRIYQYDILGDQLKVIVDEANSHEYFSVSYDGSTLAYISRDSLIGVIDLPTLGATFFTPPDRPEEEITVDQFGSSAAFTALRDSGSIILRLAIQGGFFTELTANPGANAASPLFSRLGFPFAWRQNDGLYIRYGFNQDSTRLSNQSLKPNDFSPAGRYLSTGEKIFDLNFQDPLPITINGESRFLTETTILYKTNDTHTIYRSNLGGTEKEILAGPLSPASAFAPSPEGRFLAYFNSNADSTRLVIQNLDEKRNVVDKNLPLGSNNYVETVYWRNKPDEGG